MKSETFVIQHPVGLHARPAALFVQAAMAHQSIVNVTKDGKTVNAKSIMGILSLAVHQNDTITVTVEGSDEQQALNALSELVANNFGE